MHQKSENILFQYINYIYENDEKHSFEFIGFLN